VAQALTDAFDALHDQPEVVECRGQNVRVLGQGREVAQPGENGTHQN
jgi:hypothetical protein